MNTKPDWKNKEFSETISPPVLKDHTRIVFAEMCRRVGADIVVVERGLKNHPEHDPLWYHKYSWTREEEESFTKWLADYLYKNRKARFEILRLSYRPSKKWLRDWAQSFIGNWGWKIDRGIEKQS